jgi:uracil-DNA glycosylase
LSTTSIINPNIPYALKHAEEKERRQKMLAEPYMKPLVTYLEQVRTAMGTEYEMPMFDPCDGGINARILFLLEAPGPKAVGSAFISRNNPDPTARNMCDFLANANISRHDTLLWNIVPWYIGDKNTESGRSRIRPANKKDIVTALPHLEALIQLLPKLEIIVLAGGKAQSASKDIAKITSVVQVNICHTSNLALNGQPGRRAELATNFAEIAKMLT